MKKKTSFGQVVHEYFQTVKVVLRYKKVNHIKGLDHILVLKRNLFLSLVIILFIVERRNRKKIR